MFCKKKIIIIYKSIRNIKEIKTKSFFIFSFFVKCYKFINIFICLPRN